MGSTCSVPRCDDQPPDSQDRPPSHLHEWGAGITASSATALRQLERKVDELSAQLRLQQTQHNAKVAALEAALTAAATRHQHRSMAASGRENLSWNLQAIPRSDASPGVTRSTSKSTEDISPVAFARDACPQEHAAAIRSISTGSSVISSVSSPGDRHSVSGLGAAGADSVSDPYHIPAGSRLDRLEHRSDSICSAESSAFTSVADPADLQAVAVSGISDNKQRRPMVPLENRTTTYQGDETPPPPCQSSFVAEHLHGSASRGSMRSGSARNISDSPGYFSHHRTGAALSSRSPKQPPWDRPFASQSETKVQPTDGAPLTSTSVHRTDEKDDEQTKEVHWQQSSRAKMVEMTDQHYHKVPADDLKVQGGLPAELAPDDGWAAVTVEPRALSAPQQSATSKLTSEYKLDSSNQAIRSTDKQSNRLKSSVIAPAAHVLVGVDQDYTQMEKSSAASNGADLEEAVDHDRFHRAAVAVQAALRGWRLRGLRHAAVSPALSTGRAKADGLLQIDTARKPINFARLSTRLGSDASGALWFREKSCASCGGPAAAIAEPFSVANGIVPYFVVDIEKTVDIPAEGCARSSKHPEKLSCVSLHEEAAGATHDQVNLPAMITVGLANATTFEAGTPPGFGAGTVGLELRTGRLYVSGLELTDHRLAPCQAGDQVGCGFVEAHMKHPIVFWTVNDALVCVIEFETVSVNRLRAAIGLWPVHAATSTESTLRLNLAHGTCGGRWEQIVRKHMTAHYEVASKPHNN
eukprot:SAG31_NODE_3490_length_4203_cov_2.570663_1_plen_753_part_00